DYYCGVWDSILTAVLF
nr:immunoglobulin light chain junction region [Macaca mulatta]